MKIVAIHNISDPDAFFAAGQEAAEAGLPEGFVLQVLTRTIDGTKGVCIWEGPSVESVRDLVDSIVGPYSENEYFEVETRGLPE